MGSTDGAGVTARIARWGRALLATVVVLPASCQAAGDAAPPGGAPDGLAPSLVPAVLVPAELGALSVSLVTTVASEHRLRGAIFSVDRAGVTVTTLDAEAAVDAEALRAELPPGPYRLTLGGGWWLERLQEDGSAALVHAALISPNPVAFEVHGGRVTRVAFTFTTPTGTLTLGQGSVEVRLGVVDPASLAACDVASQTGCAAGQHCLLGAGQAFCATPGELPVGATCSAEQCVAGAQCLALAPGSPRTCTALCDPSLPAYGCDCVGVTGLDAVGVCGPPPPSACDLLDPGGCPDGQVCQYPGGSFGVCGAPGAQPEGGLCFGEECEAGLDCYGDEPAFGVPGTCLRFCDLLAPECELCFGTGTGDAGRCFL